MVILITGAPHTGKTLLAQRMLEKYRYPAFSIDHLKMGLIRSGNTALTPLDDDALTDYLWPIVREIIKTAIENRQNLYLILAGKAAAVAAFIAGDEHISPPGRTRYLSIQMDSMTGCFSSTTRKSLPGIAVCP